MAPGNVFSGEGRRERGGEWSGVEWSGVEWSVKMYGIGVERRRETVVCGLHTSFLVGVAALIMACSERNKKKKKNREN